MYVKQYDQAIYNYKKALGIRELLFGDKHISVGATCNNLGNAYEHKEDVQSSIEYTRRALVIFEANPASVPQSDVDRVRKSLDRLIKHFVERQ